MDMVWYQFIFNCFFCYVGTILKVAYSALGVEYTDCIFTEGFDSPNGCPMTLNSKIELWEMRNYGVVAPERVVSMGEIEHNCVLMLNLFRIELFWNFFSRKYIFVYTQLCVNVLTGKCTYGKKKLLVGWLVGWILWHINFCRLSNTKSIFIQIICYISNNSV